MMNHPKKSLSKPSAVLLAASLFACGGSQQPQASAPPTMQTSQSAPSTSDEYGSAMGQPGPATGTTTTPENATPPPQGGNGMYGPDTTTSPSAGGTLGGSPSPMMNPNTGTGPAGGMHGMGAGGMMDVSGMTDAQLAAIVQTLNTGEIQEAQVAQAKASSPDVKRFAQEMMNGHREMLMRQNALFTRLQIMPADNAVSSQMKANTQNQLSMLQQVGGHDFDRSYVDDQVGNHNKALELVDRIMPNVKNADFRTALQEDRSMIETHLRQAEVMQQTLQKGMTNPQPGSPELGNPPKPRGGSTPYLH
jgi:putative membrane protein